MNPGGRSEKWKGGQRSASPQTKHQPPGKPKRKRLIPWLLGILLVTLGVCVGFFLGFSAPVEPYILSLVVTELNDPQWPIARWARQDSLRLTMSAEALRPQQDQSRANIIAKLGVAAGNARANKRPLLVHLITQVVLGPEGPMLVTSESRSGESDRQLLPLRDVLDKLRGENLNCLLLLDLRTIDLPWLGGLGALDGPEVYSALTQYYQENPKHKLATLCFCQNGLPPLVSNELGCGIFSQAIQEALGGFANTWNSAGKDDNNVTCRELALYANARVQQWCAAHALSVQLPVFLASADFVIRSWAQARDGQDLTLNEPVDYPPELLKAWQDRDAWLLQQHHLIAPLAVRRAQSALLRGEQRWMGGDRSEDDKKRVLDDLAEEIKLYGRLSTLKKAKDSTSWLRDPLTAPKETEALLQPVEAALQKLGGPLKEEEWAGAKAAIAPLIPKHADLSAQLICKAVFAWPEPTMSQLKRANELLLLAKGPNRAETNFLRFLAALDDRQGRDWQPSLRVFLDLILAAERALPADPRALRYVQEAIRAADAQFHQDIAATADIFLNSQGRIKVVDRLPQTNKTYGDIKNMGDAVIRALQERDTCLALLPALAYYDSADRETAGAIQAQWKQLIPPLQQLLSRLDSAKNADIAWASDLRGVTELVQERRGKLIAALAVIPPKSPPAALQHSLLYASWPAAIRQDRYAKAQMLAQDLARPALARPDRQKMQMPLLEASEPLQLTGVEFHLSARATDLLQLAGHPAVVPLKNALAAAQARPDPQNCQKLRDLLTGIWSSRTTQLVRLPQLWYVPAFGEESLRDPLLQEHKDAQAAMLRWLADQRYSPLVTRFDQINKEVARSFRDLADKALLPPAP